MSQTAPFPWLASAKLSPKIYVSKYYSRWVFTPYNTPPVQNTVEVNNRPINVRCLIVRDTMPPWTYTTTPSNPTYEDICDADPSYSALWTSAFYRRDMGNRFQILHDKRFTIRGGAWSDGSGTYFWTSYKGLWKQRRMRFGRVKGMASMQPIAAPQSNSYRLAGHMYMIITSDAPGINISPNPCINFNSRLWYYDKI